MSEEKRLYLVRIIVSLGFLIGIILSTKLWLSDRSYPFAPIVHFLPQIPTPLDYLILTTIILLLVVIAAARKVNPASAIHILLALIFTLSLFDQSRLQPWAYQYWFMLAALSFLPWPYKEGLRTSSVLNTLRLILICMYFWAGVQKLNPNFSTNIFPWIINGVVSGFPLPSFAGYIAAFGEIAIGTGLIFQKTRNLAIAAALLMWMLLIVSLGPLGYSSNSVIWPWIVSMACFTVLLFYKTKTKSLQVFQNKNFLFQKVVLVIFGILPLFSFFNLWDSYLSAALYSGNTRRAEIYLSQDVIKQTPLNIQRYVFGNSLNYHNWSYEELNVPTYPENRVYKSLARYFCRYATNPSEVRVVLSQTRSLANYHLRLDCAGL